MAFSFGFSHEDDDEQDGIAPTSGSSHQPSTSNDASSTVKLPPVKSLQLEEVLRTLPERISYSTVKVESPLGRTVYLPRRELFDAKVQLMVESDNDDGVIDQLQNSDIRTGIYEGGFKTWECSLDLASLLLDRGPRKDIDELVRCDQVIELGAGTALPSLVLFQHALTNSISGITFTLADYNEEVLRLVTVPNLFLTWAASTGMKSEAELDLHADSQGDLEVTPELIDQFLLQLRSLSCEINLLSGPWSPALADAIPPSAPDMGTVVLAAETIYSLESTQAFVNVLSIILKRVKMAKAMVGAKRIYFGVGGSVDGLKEACRDIGAVAYEIDNHGVPGMDNGVGRALIELQMY